MGLWNRTSPSSAFASENAPSHPGPSSLPTDLFQFSPARQQPTFAAANVKAVIRAVVIEVLPQDSPTLRATPGDLETVSHLLISLKASPTTLRCARQTQPKCFLGVSTKPTSTSSPEQYVIPGSVRKPSLKRHSGKIFSFPWKWPQLLRTETEPDPTDVSFGPSDHLMNFLGLFSRPQV